MRPVQYQRWEFIRCCEFEMTVNTGWCKNGITEDKPSKENPGLQPQVVFTSTMILMTLHPITVQVLAKNDDGDNDNDDENVVIMMVMTMMSF